jgi:hypothetical protein
MTRNYPFTAVLGLASMLCPWVAAQVPASASPGDTQTSAIAPEDQATKVQIGNLFEVMHFRQQFESTLGTMNAVARQQMDAQMKEALAKSGEQLTPEQQEAVSKVSARFMDKAMHVVTSDEIIEDMTTIYQRHFTKADIAAATEFYSSPAGQHMLSEQPAILKEYMPAVMKRVNERMQTLLDEMTSEMKEALQEAKPAGK